LPFEYERVRDQRGLLRTALGYAYHQRGPMTRFYDDGKSAGSGSRGKVSFTVADTQNGTPAHQPTIGKVWFTWSSPMS
jgi:hypothetical protein